MTYIVSWLFYLLFYYPIIVELGVHCDTMHRCYKSAYNPVSWFFKRKERLLWGSFGPTNAKIKIRLLKLPYPYTVDEYNSECY
jgi:hypothetical protein